MQGHKPLVLIVEDNEDIAAWVGDILELHGYAVEKALSGEEALAYLSSTRQRPCIVLLDLVMPNMSGWDLIRHLRPQDRLVAIPIAVLSVTGTPQAIPDGIRVVKKPVAILPLISAVEEHCGPPPVPPVSGDPA